MFKNNPELEDRINRFGQTTDLPLFALENKSVKNIPAWIWDGSGIKAEVYERIKNSRKTNTDALKVLSEIIKKGGKATDHEVKKATGLDLHIVSARRNDLKKLGWVTSYGKKKMGPHGSPNTVWEVNYTKLFEDIN